MNMRSWIAFVMPMTLTGLGFVRGDTNDGVDGKVLLPYCPDDIFRPGICQYNFKGSIHRKEPALCSGIKDEIHPRRALLMLWKSLISRCGTRACV